MAIAPVCVLIYLVYNAFKVVRMKLLRTKMWNWWDAWMLKWSAFLFGIAAGAYFHEVLVQYVLVILIVAVLLAIKPTIAYFKD
jgi:hypothetical protein